MRILAKALLCFFLILILAGCASTTPKGFLKLPENHLEKRQTEMRLYETKDEEKIISAVAGVLQDLGFILDDSETKLGFVSASKKADAKSGGQMTAAFFLDVLSAMGGSQGNNMNSCDKEQLVKASVITKPSLKGNETSVRVTFQRIVWNMNNQISRVETVNDPEIYVKFFNDLSKSIFLEAQEI
ncbi:MAG: hypothetical protein L6416_05655 [Candidatus Omnitrophica bacterium]|nr:hypothetical protein [Candidatus Omnitrophota bacterium]